MVVIVTLYLPSTSTTIQPECQTAESRRWLHQGLSHCTTVSQKVISHMFPPQPSRSLFFICTVSLGISFALSSSVISQDAREVKVPSSNSQSNVHRRGNFINSWIQFAEKKQGTVAFMGGSITEMNGYRPMVCSFLEKQFPQTKFTFINAGISSTCSTTGAHRLQRDVLSKGPIDLFFVEFAVNDDQDAAHAAKECTRGMEGVLRQALTKNPQMDIVMVHFINPPMLEAIQSGGTRISRPQHEKVAQTYGVSSIDLAKEVADRITNKTLTWKDFGGTHPAPKGNAIAASMIEQMLKEGWNAVSNQKESFKKLTHSIPDKPLDAGNYAKGRFVSPMTAQFDKNWSWSEPDWKEIPGSKRSRFLKRPLLHTDHRNAELTLKFEGKAIGAYLLAGPDAGTVEVQVDDGSWKKVDLYHRYSKGLHYPRTVMFATDLKEGPHSLTLRVSQEKNRASKGYAVRILEFAVN